MIARLTGIIAEIYEAHVILDVGGVGYKVFCPTSTLRALPGKGESATLEVETHIREDHFHLYGFVSELERTWFVLLMEARGVGARVALAILGCVSLEALDHAIASGDVAVLTQTPGIGPKLAKSICHDLKDKAGLAAPTAAATESMVQEACSALMNLGFTATEARRAVNEAWKADPSQSLEALISHALRLVR